MRLLRWKSFCLIILMQNKNRRKKQIKWHVILQIDFAFRRSMKEQRRICVKRTSLRWWKDDEKLRINCFDCCDRIIFFEEWIFVIFKYRNHVLENRQLYDTKIIKQTIIITKIKNNNFLVNNTSMQHQRFANDQQSKC